MKCLNKLSEQLKNEIVYFYMEPHSQKETSKHFGLPLHTIVTLLKHKKTLRGKYSAERNKLVSYKIKETLKNNPSIIADRVKLHTGAKRTIESRKKMQESAWKRMETQSNKYVSKAETKFGEYLKNKLGLKVVPQYRINLKPFDFLVEDKFLIEFDGPHHYLPDFYLYKNKKEDYKKQQERDSNRFDIAKKAGMKLIVVQQKDLTKNMELKGDFAYLLMKELGYSCV